jgi:hypothetical protein
MVLDKNIHNQPAEPAIGSRVRRRAGQTDCLHRQRERSTRGRREHQSLDGLAVPALRLSICIFTPGVVVTVQLSWSASERPDMTADVVCDARSRGELANG